MFGVLSTDNNIPLYTLSEVTIDGQKYTDFKHKTAAQILDDINGMFAYQAKITKGVEHADTLSFHIASTSTSPLVRFPEHWLYSASFPQGECSIPQGNCVCTGVRV